VQATREIVEDLGTRQSPAETTAAEAAAAVVDGRGAISPPTIRMVACPARDEADEVALLMVWQLLDPMRYELEVVSAAMPTAEVVSVVEQQGVSLIALRRFHPGHQLRPATCASGCGPGPPSATSWWDAESSQGISKRIGSSSWWPVPMR
jgi:hypothetical protein